MTQLLLVVVGLVLVFSPDTLVDNVHLGVAPTWKDFFLAIPVGMIAYTGIETISNMAEEAKDETKTIPAAINRVVIAVFAIYALLPVVALSALPVVQDPDGQVPDPARAARGAGRLRRRPDPRRGQADPPRGLPAARRDLRRPARGHDPLHRDQRRHHRRLAARLLDGHPPPGARPPAPAAPAVRHALDRHRALRRDRLPGDDPRARPTFLGNMYAFGAMLSFTIAHLSVDPRCATRRPTSTGPTAGPATLRVARRRACRCSPCSAASAPCWPSSSSRSCTSTSPSRASGWLALGCIIYPVYRRRQGLDLTTTTKVAIPRPVVDHEAEYESVLVALESKTFSEGAMATAVRLAARRRRGIHVLVTIVVPSSSPIDAPLPEQEAGGPGHHRAGAGSSAAAASPATGRRSAPGRRAG